MGLLYRDDFSLGWQPGFDQRRGDPRGCLRFDNLRLDGQGKPRLRLGSLVVSGTTPLIPGGGVRKLFTTRINEVRYRYAQCDDGVFVSTSVGSYSQIQSGFDPDTDIAIEAQLGQVFTANGEQKFKHDGSNTREWGIDATPPTPSVSTTDSNINPISTCDDTESPPWEAKEGEVESADGQDDTPGGARMLVCSPSTGKGTIQRVLATESDYLTFPDGEDGVAEDLIEFYVWVSAVELLDYLTLKFDCNGDDTSETARFRDDYYYHDFTFDDAEEVKLSEGDQLLDDRYDVEGFDRADVSDRYEKTRTPFRSRFRRDTPPPLGNEGWAKFSVPRGRFQRVGNTPGKNWSTIKAIQLTVKGLKPDADAGISAINVKLDGISAIGGAEHTLSGRFRVRAVYYAKYDTHTVRSTPSGLSNEIECRANGLSCNVATGSAFNLHVVGGIHDPECGVEFYVMGGSMNGFYLGATKIVHSGSLAFDGPETTPFLFIPPTRTEDPAATGVVTLSERDMLIQDIKLVADRQPPPDGIIACAPHKNRMLALTDKELHISERFNPESFPLSFIFPVGNRSFTAYWLASEGGDIFVGTSIDIFVLEGQGDEYHDGSTDFRLRGLGVGEPPITDAVAAEGGKVVYLASDGPRMLQGASGQTVSLKANLDLLYQGEGRYAIAAPNLGSQPGRFRFAMWGHRCYAVVPEGDGTPRVLHVLDFNTQSWRRERYPRLFLTVYREPDGKILAGDDTGTVYQLQYPNSVQPPFELVESPDTSYFDTESWDEVVSGGAIVQTKIEWRVWFKFDDNQQPTVRKEPFDWRSIIESSDDVEVVIYADEVGPFWDHFFITGPSQNEFYRKLSGLTAPTSMQVRMGGEATYLRLQSFGIAYRERPFPRLYWDSGFLDALGDVVWIRRMEFKMRAPANVAVTIQFESGQLHSSTIVVTPDLEDVYTVPIERFVRGRLPRITIDGSTAGAEPFELYFVDIWYTATGVPTVTKKRLMTVERTRESGA